MIHPNLWASNPKQAHSDWRDSLAVADRTYALQSQRLYRSLFGKFCAWLATQPCDLQTLRSTDITRFLKTLKGRSGLAATHRTQRTYVAELDRVLTRLQVLELREDNPARAMLGDLRIVMPLRPRSITLPRNDTRINYLATLVGIDAATMLPEQVQSVAMNLLMLDGGLTLKELQKISFKNSDDFLNERIQAPGHRAMASRIITTTPEAQTWLNRWLDIRKDLRAVTPDQYKALQVAAKSGVKFEVASEQGPRSARHRLFVSFTGKSGKPLGLRSSGLVIDRVPDSTIYLSAQQVMFAGRKLTAAERVKQKNKGPQALRTLCCVGLVTKGLKPDEIAQFLGLRGPDQVWAMMRALRISPA